MFGILNLLPSRATKKIKSGRITMRQRYVEQLRATRKSLATVRASGETNDAMVPMMRERVARLRGEVAAGVPAEIDSAEFSFRDFRFERLSTALADDLYEAELKLAEYEESQEDALYQTSMLLAREERLVLWLEADDLAARESLAQEAHDETKPTEVELVLGAEAIPRGQSYGNATAGSYKPPVKHIQGATVPAELAMG